MVTGRCIPMRVALCGIRESLDQLTRTLFGDDSQARDAAVIRYAFPDATPRRRGRFQVFAPAVGVRDSCV